MDTLKMGLDGIERVVTKWVFFPSFYSLKVLRPRFWMIWLRCGLTCVKNRFKKGDGKLEN
jgi:hypothetical protein